MKTQCNLWAVSKWLLEKLENVKDLLLIIKLIINILRCYNIKKRLATHSLNNDDYLWKVWWDLSENIPIFGSVKNALNLLGQVPGELKLWVRLFVSLFFCTFWRCFLSILSIAEICPHNPVCFPPNCAFFHQKSSHNWLFFSDPVRWEMPCHDFILLL